jgi:3-oxoadipate enol-lactonase
MIDYDTLPHTLADQDQGMNQYVFMRAGCPIHYWLTGPKDAPLIVFTHGAAMDHQMFTAQVEALASRYRLLWWDVPGHGRSRPLTDQYSIPYAAEALLALLDQIGAERVILVGHSMGGYISQEFLFRYPSQAAALITIGSSCLTLEHPKLLAQAMHLSPHLVPIVPYRTLVWWAARYISVTEEVRKYVEQVVLRHTKAQFIEIWSAVMHCLHPEPGYQITQPVLITHGAEDKLGFGLLKKQSQTWASRDPNSHYVVISQAGHNAQQENPSHFNRVLLDFLAEYELNRSNRIEDIEHDQSRQPGQ